MKSDLIRKDEAIEAVQRCCPESAMYRAIRDVPSVDAEEIVRCEECIKTDGRFCDIHDIYGAKWCSLGKKRGKE